MTRHPRPLVIVLAECGASSSAASVALAATMVASGGTPWTASRQLGCGGLRCGF